MAYGDEKTEALARAIRDNFPQLIEGIKNLAEQQRQSKISQDLATAVTIYNNPQLYSQELRDIAYAKIQMIMNQKRETQNNNNHSFFQKRK